MILTSYLAHTKAGFIHNVQLNYISVVGNFGMYRRVGKFNNLYWLLLVHLGDEIRENEFKFGEVRSLTFKRANIVIHANCTNPSKNFIKCESEERTKSWKFSYTYQFSTVRIICPFKNCN